MQDMIRGFDGDLNKMRSMVGAFIASNKDIECKKFSVLHQSLDFYLNLLSKKYYQHAFYSILTLIIHPLLNSLSKDKYSNFQAQLDFIITSYGGDLLNIALKERCESPDEAGQGVYDVSKHIGIVHAEFLQKVWTSQNLKQKYLEFVGPSVEVYKAKIYDCKNSLSGLQSASDSALECIGECPNEVQYEFNVKITESNQYGCIIREKVREIENRELSVKSIEEGLDAGDKFFFPEIDAYDIGSELAVLPRHGFFIAAVCKDVVQKLECNAGYPELVARLHEVRAEINSKVFHIQHLQAHSVSASGTPLSPSRGTQVGGQPPVLSSGSLSNRRLGVFGQSPLRSGTGSFASSIKRKVAAMLSPQQ